MKHQTVEHVRTLAAVRSEAVPLMTSRERLERWAYLLEEEPDRRLRTLYETEHRRQRARETLRSCNSPISVAFADLTFRAQGLADDTYGEAKRFFEVSDRQMHSILCYCHFGETISAGAAAQAIRLVVAAESRRPWFTRLRQSLSGLLSGG
jgi:hypothetical protein